MIFYFILKAHFNQPNVHIYFFLLFLRESDQKNKSSVLQRNPADFKTSFLYCFLPRMCLASLFTRAQLGTAEAAQKSERNQD